MKRYDLFSKCLCGVGFEPLCEESTDGSWVEAEIAQELYDMLLYTLNEMEHNPILEADIQEVLTKANRG